MRRCKLMSVTLFVLGNLLAALSVSAQQIEALPTGYTLEEQAQLRQQVKRLGERIATLQTRRSPLPQRATVERLADVDLFLKGVVWALRYESNLSETDRALIRRALERGAQRVAALEEGKTPWAGKTGRLVRGYRSAVDGSTQPYGLLIPANYDPRRPIRLDVVLHGSTHPTGLGELRFLMPFDEGDENAKPGAPGDFIELHPLGRVENCYRWAGETDVFEAIEDVCRCYNIDRDRIVLRGMSMGASGTWHLGLKHPGVFVALGPYCGYVDTHRFSETPGMNFVRVGELPPYQEQALRMLDSADYAANAGVVPVVAAIGERDPFFQAHVIMGEAFRREGLRFVNLISPGTGHVIDPVTFAEQMRQIGAFTERGVNRTPHSLRFVTWTLKYARCHWLELLGLRAHYQRAEIQATVTDEGAIQIAEPKNITRFALLAPILSRDALRLRVGNKTVSVPPRRRKKPGSGIVIEQRNGRWTYAGERAGIMLKGKQPGLQGPIDDAFTRPFLCVRGTGKAWNPTVQAWAEANLKRFAYEWNRYFRGELPVKDDTEVTAEDCRRCNLILFGDPGSNLWIRRALPSLPLRWTRDTVRIGATECSSADHAPALICLSPFGKEKGATARYLVLNSGHTFHEAELDRLNYLLFPRLGDWAILKIGGPAPSRPSDPLPEEVIRADFFNEMWQPNAPTAQHAHTTHSRKERL